MNVFRFIPAGVRTFVFVRVETDAGIIGWGEAYSQYDRDRAVAAQVEELGRYLIGRDPFQIRHILQIAFDDYAQRRGSLELYCATSGIEQALWDIVGKATKQPVYNLLGGPCRSKIRVYANGWSYKLQEPEDYARKAEAVIKSGFSAIKFDPVPGPWRTYVPKEHVRRAVKVLRAVRDAVGPDIDLLLDIHRRLAPMHAIDLADALAEFEPYWLEEPCQSENVEALADVRHRQQDSGRHRRGALYACRFSSDLPRACRRHHQSGRFELWRHSRADVYRGGSGNRMIAVSPHNYNSTTLALSATVHASACMPNFIITEYFLPFEEIGARLCPNLLKPVDGYISLPEGPGLGLEVDENAVRAARGQQFPARTFRFPKDEGP